jgi:MOSC domain-containing protein YiiM
MGDASFVDRFGAAARFGAYLRILKGGDIGAGDEIDIGAPPPDGGITVHEIGIAEHDAPAELCDRLLRDAYVPENWKSWAKRRIASRAGEAG